jgi:hypothetical protein
VSRSNGLRDGETGATFRVSWPRRNDDAKRPGRIHQKRPGHVYRELFCKYRR